MLFVLLIFFAASGWTQTVGRIITVLPKSDGTDTGELRLRELNANGQQYISHSAPTSLGASYRLFWPGTNANGFLKNTGGTLTFEAVPGGGDVFGPATHADNYVPQWNGANSKTLKEGLAVSVASSNNSLVQRGGAGEIFGGAIEGTRLLGLPGGDIYAGLFRRFSASQAANIVQYMHENGSTVLSAIDKDGHFTGRSATTLAFAVNPSDCSVGQFANTIEANGNLGCSTAGNVIGPATHADNYVPQWNGANSKTLKEGLQVATTAVALSLVQRNSGGGIAANGITGNQLSISNPGTDTPSGIFQRFSSGQTSNLVNYLNDGGGIMSSIDRDGNFTGRSATTLAFATNPTDCAGGQFANAIDASGNLTCATPPGGGDVIGPATNSDNFFPQWNGVNSKTLKNGFGSAGGANIPGNSLMLRDTFGAASAYDAGGQVYNVHAYGATGNGSSDDTTAIQNAITACQDGAGGPVVFHGKVYAISGTLAFGDGSSSQNTTKKPCWIQGAGSGDGTGIPRGTEIKWTASNPASVTNMIELRGPGAQFNMYDVFINPNSNSNVRAIKAQQIAFFTWRNVTIVNQAGGPAVTFKPVRSYHPTNSNTPNGCTGVVQNLTINAPASGGEGVLFDETSGLSGNIPDTCSVQFINGNWHGSTYGTKITFADNLHFLRMQFHGSGSGNCSITFTQSTVNSQFPHENRFDSVSATGGACGTTGTGQPNMFIGWNQGDCSSNCDLTDLGASQTRVVVLDSRGDLRNFYGAHDSTDEEKEVFGVHARSGGQNGAGIVAFRRENDTRGVLRGHYVDGLRVRWKDGASGLQTRFQVHPTGKVAFQTLNLNTGTDLCYLTTDLHFESGMKALSACASLRRLKTDIVPILSGLSLVRPLRPVSYTSLTNHRREVGLIAEEVEQVFPELATYLDGSLIGVDYKHLSAVAVRAIQELEARLIAAEARIATLEKAARRQD